MQEIRIKNSAECTTIDIEGTIGVPEEWQFEEPQQRVATYESFRRTLQQIEELKCQKVVVNIRSTGGDVGDALLIYDALVALDAEITTRCWGYVASAATVIAQAASEGLREISANALYLVHSSTCNAEGNALELLQRAELLKKSDERLAELYARRSGREVEAFEALMSEEGGEGRWLNARETIEAGLADREIEGVASEASSETSESAETTESLTEEGLENVDNGDDNSLSEQISKGVDEVYSSVKGLFRRVAQRLQLRDAKEVSSVAKVIDTDVNNAINTDVDNSGSVGNVIDTMSVIAFEERQRELRSTKVAECEDPSLREARASANQRAYARDAKRLR